MANEIDDNGSEPDILDLEENSKAGKDPRKAAQYRIRIDKEYKVVDAQEMNGRQILALVGKTPESHLLSQKLTGGQVKPVAEDETINFAEHGVERFQTLALDPTEG
jgi:hypothetical protein